jgi:hypothetical protein
MNETNQKEWDGSVGSTNDMSDECTSANYPRHTAPVPADHFRGGRRRRRNELLLYAGLRQSQSPHPAMTMTMIVSRSTIRMVLVMAVGRVD